MVICIKTQQYVYNILKYVYKRGIIIVNKFR